MPICNISDRELAFQNALTVSLAGCGKAYCLRGRPPKLCPSCALQVTILLARAGAHGTAARQYRKSESR